jgi:hypothetical protein
LQRQPRGGLSQVDATISHPTKLPGRRRYVQTTVNAGTMENLRDPPRSGPMSTQPFPRERIQTKGSTRTRKPLFVHNRECLASYPKPCSDRSEKPTILQGRLPITTGIHCTAATAVLKHPSGASFLYLRTTLHAPNKPARGRPREAAKSVTGAMRAKGPASYRRATRKESPGDVPCISRALASPSQARTAKGSGSRTRHSMVQMAI